MERVYTSSTPGIKFGNGLVFLNITNIIVSKGYDSRLVYRCGQVSLARPSSDNIKGANLYVSGLPRSMTQADMDELFAPYGNIVTSRILCDLQTGIPFALLCRLMYTRGALEIILTGCCLAVYTAYPGK